uniref:Hcy-binding domain-containing protein n=2 Tax=Aplanochytrium stocchinoi TaxID=215587 RepID=A0A7S3UZT6_9STRA|mmetsp:Transcript_3452/g.4636  ORF Transcript_3452/g.4636 Transcript_3452/m.4636 type:complete len:327 (+) Transcript_3452:84-1064(+)|eukprot:CAMPEP_0204825702 /NCGR_PEP_ID=MMETSP1346-20131115/3530_1 /ASSEMBLY_ACC=CAM_ASM_000771 /TAXON_ID=215587 /ORGANISM="Aplanochytrium stocchinoi, Strain GSBS06" /LENGTH=326 /DNA_ID=CAMNT_0051953417 /DNA_START=67 /DNA_END=1047 /DNA_ORIENTATION=-
MEELKRIISGDWKKKDSKHGLVLTHPGIETFLLYDMGFPLREFAAFEVCLDSSKLGRLRESLLNKVINMAIAADVLLLLEAPTWRASPDFLRKLEYEIEDLERVNDAAVKAQIQLQEEWKAKGLRSIVGAELGPRGDGYITGDSMSANEAEAYHKHQIQALKKAGVEMITAYTMTNLPESIGVARAAARSQVPIVISATVETDGKLPDKTSLDAFITAIDEELTKASLEKPLYYMINCAHPDHFDQVLLDGAGKEWRKRLKGIRANSSNKSHEELDNLETIDNGDPYQLGQSLSKWHLENDVAVLGGCCGTDHRHIEQILKHCNRI